MSESDIIGRLQLNGEEYTGIFSGLNPKVFRSVDIGALQAENGWIFDEDGRMEPWYLQGVTEQDGGMVFYGPAVNARPVDPEQLDLTMLRRINNLFRALADKGAAYDGFFLGSWLFLEDGGVLVLPVQLMSFIRKSGSEAIRERNWYPYNHPDRRGPEAMAFTMGVLTMISLSGKHPYAPLEEQEDDRNEQFRRPPVLPAELSVPGLKERIAAVVDASFKEGSTPAAWSKALDFWREKDALEELDDSRRKVLEERAEQIRSRGEKNRKRRQIWRRKSTFYLAAAAGIVALGLIVSAPLKNALKPPATLGLSPREVVEAYYDGFNSMSQEVMEDCIAKDLGKGDLNEVMNFYVTSRVRLGYEGKTGVLSAADWVAAGRPELEPGVSLYGTAELEIQDLGGGQFRVNYEKWIPGSAENPDLPPETVIPPRGMYITDLVTLEEQKKGNWLIIARDRTIREITE